MTDTLAEGAAAPTEAEKARVTVVKRMAAARARERERKTGCFVDLYVRMPAEVAPALRSAIEEARNTIGGRLVGHFSYAREQALTDAARGLGILAKEVNARIPAGDPYFDRDPEDEKR